MSDTFKKRLPLILKPLSFKYIISTAPDSQCQAMKKEFQPVLSSVELFCKRAEQMKLYKMHGSVNLADGQIQDDDKTLLDIKKLVKQTLEIFRMLDKGKHYF